MSDDGGENTGGHSPTTAENNDPSSTIVETHQPADSPRGEHDETAQSHQEGVNPLAKTSMSLFSDAETGRTIFSDSSTVRFGRATGETSTPIRGEGSSPRISHTSSPRGSEPRTPVSSAEKTAKLRKLFKGKEKAIAPSIRGVKTSSRSNEYDGRPLNASQRLQATRNTQATGEDDTNAAEATDIEEDEEIEGNEDPVENSDAADEEDAEEDGYDDSENESAPDDDEDADQESPEGADWPSEVESDNEQGEANKGQDETDPAEYEVPERYNNSNILNPTRGIGGASHRKWEEQFRNIYSDITGEKTVRSNRTLGDLRTSSKSTNHVKHWDSKMAIFFLQVEFSLAGHKFDESNDPVFPKSEEGKLYLTTRETLCKEFQEFAEKMKDTNRKKSKLTVTGMGLTRRVKNALKDCQRAYLDGEYFRTRKKTVHWLKKLPTQAEILACRFLHPYGQMNGTIGGALATLRKSHLSDIPGPGGQVISQTVAGGTHDAASAAIAANAASVTKQTQEQLEKALERIDTLEKSVAQIRNTRNTRSDGDSDALRDKFVQIEAQAEADAEANGKAFERLIEKVNEINTRSLRTMVLATKQDDAVKEIASNGVKFVNQTRSVSDLKNRMKACELKLDKFDAGSVTDLQDRVKACEKVQGKIGAGKLTDACYKAIYDKVISLEKAKPTDPPAQKKPTIEVRIPATTKTTSTKEPGKRKADEELRETPQKKSKTATTIDLRDVPDDSSNFTGSPTPTQESTPTKAKPAPTKAPATKNVEKPPNPSTPKPKPASMKEQMQKRARVDLNSLLSNLK